MAVPAPDVIIDPVPGAPPVPAPAAPPKPATALAERPRRSAAPTPNPPRRRSRSVVVPSSIGAVAAVAVIAAAVLLRPEVEVGSTPVAAAAVAAPEIASAPAEAAVTIFLKVAPTLALVERQRIQAALATAGYERVVVHQVPFTISRSRVGYFREEDRASAEALIAALGGTLRAIELRDYRALMPAPEPGRLDLWIGS